MKFGKSIITAGITPTAPYSPGVQCGPLVYTAATSTDWKTGKELTGTIEKEIRTTIENIKRVLKAAGSSLKDVIKATVYLTNFDDFESYNKVWARYFKDGLPARATIGISKLFGKCKIEIDVVALVRKGRTRKSK